MCVSELHFSIRGMLGVVFCWMDSNPGLPFRVTNAKKHMGDIEEVQMIQIWGNKGGGG